MSNLWVGQVNVGAALVFDPEMQLPGCPHIFLWEVATCSMEPYVAAIARAKMSTIKDCALMRQHSASYLGWKEAHGKSWLNSERGYYEIRASRAHNETLERLRDQLRRSGPYLRPLSQEEAEREAIRLSLMTPEQRHKERLDQMGLLYSGVRALRAGRRQRNAHCYACKEPLNSLAEFECDQCRWILCDCGACGCGYWLDK